QSVHHDPGAARAQGAADVFMNILTTQGLVQRYATDWAGPAARVRRIAIRLGAPNHAGDALLLTGTAERTGGAAEVAVRGANSLGAHVTGTVTVEEEGLWGCQARRRSPGSAPPSSPRSPAAPSCGWPPRPCWTRWTTPG